ncbi:hypothetical protein D4741_20075 [Pseudoalteromonas gelatinilytica]|uniref:Uncharacterized protein n=1 Tax=Pseudoalteromonas gelatinilytica TaxID=1703256 RepID=A0A3A3EKS7_9GAMM|nr:hypothetical protein [Pseudoalteromonas profundi]RJF32071.1 hypothetical protein D4741_20075 [Pseudoalteromonas profundi]
MSDNSDIKLGLTQFIKYTLKGSGAQARAVREIKYQDEYHPAFDYWKVLREGIIKYHSEGHNNDYLYTLLNSVEQKKQENYREAVKKYLKFMKNKNVQWFDPGRAFWSIENMKVRSTPELGLIIDGQPHLIKLYFTGKKEKMDKRICKDSLTLMQSSIFDTEPSNETKFSILNIQKSKLITNDKLNQDDLIALEAQAIQFMYIWKKI